MTKPTEAAVESRANTLRAFALLSLICAAYIGVYLCRKNLTVAVPLLQKAWGLSKENLGLIASISTLTYAIGKFCFGPITDRIGGRNSLLLSMALVSLFGVLGAASPGLGMLVVVYSLNRLSGSASWGAMVKLVPNWFAPSKLAFACGLLSLSFVFGGALALAFAGLVASLSQDSWKAVLAWPSAVLGLLFVVCWVVLPKPTQVEAQVPGNEPKRKGFTRSEYLQLFRNRKFLIVLALSFTLTLLRETFNFWSVDFVKTEGGTDVSSQVAAFLSTPFDVCGAIGIVFIGWIYNRLSNTGRQRLLAGMLMALTALLLGLPSLFHLGLWLPAAGIGCIGFLAYGPYSLLAGVLSVEVRGPECAATVSGLVDGTGYFAGALSQALFGFLLTAGGYRLGFGFMACLTIASAGLCLLLYRNTELAKARTDTLTETAVETP